MSMTFEEWWAEHGSCIRPSAKAMCRMAFEAGYRSHPMVQDAAEEAEAAAEIAETEAFRKAERFLLDLLVKEEKQVTVGALINVWCDTHDGSMLSLCQAVRQHRTDPRVGVIMSVLKEAAVNSMRKETT